MNKQAKIAPEPFHYRFTRAYDTLKAKPEYASVLLLFRGGDFYEALDGDARNLASVANLILSKSRSGRPSCGIPYHALDHTVETLVAAGYRVAVAEFSE